MAVSTVVPDMQRFLNHAMHWVCSRAQCGLTVLSVSVLLGCGGDTTGVVPRSAAQTYWKLQLDQHAINLALTAVGGGPSRYDTLRLHATALNVNGTPLTTTGRVVYSTNDSSMTVDSTGLVTAYFVTAEAQVIAQLQLQNVTLSDTAFIQVTATELSSPLTTFSLRPGAGSSINCHNTYSEERFSGTRTGGCGPDSVYAKDALGNLLSSGPSPATLLVAFSSSDSSIAEIDQTGTITTNDTGHVTFRVTTWAYGIAKQDSLRYVINNPQYMLIQEYSTDGSINLSPALGFLPHGIALAVGGTLGWYNGTFRQNAIVFDDSTAVQPGCYMLNCTAYPPTGAGNINALGVDADDYENCDVNYNCTDEDYRAQVQARSFPNAGTYRFHSRLYPAVTGVVYVQDVR